MEGHEARLSTVRADLWWDGSTKVTTASLITALRSWGGSDGEATPSSWKIRKNNPNKFGLFQLKSGATRTMAATLSWP